MDKEKLFLYNPTSNADESRHCHHDVICLPTSSVTMANPLSPPSSRLRVWPISTLPALLLAVMTVIGLSVLSTRFWRVSSRGNLRARSTIELLSSPTSLPTPLPSPPAPFSKPCAPGMPAWINESTAACVRQVDLLLVVPATHFADSVPLLDAFSQSLDFNHTAHTRCVFLIPSSDLEARFFEFSVTCDVLHVPVGRTRSTAGDRLLRHAVADLYRFYNYSWLVKTDLTAFVCIRKLHTLISNFDPSTPVYIDEQASDVHENVQKDKDAVDGESNYILSNASVVALIEKLRVVPKSVEAQDGSLHPFLEDLNAHRVSLSPPPTPNTLDACVMPIKAWRMSTPNRTRLLECVEKNLECWQLDRLVMSADKRRLPDVTFVVTTDGSRSSGAELTRVYDALRALFPRNAVLVGSVGVASDGLHALIARHEEIEDRALVIKQDEQGSIADMRNQLVTFAKSYVICMLEDDMLVGAETLMVHLLNFLKGKRLTIASGFVMRHAEVEAGDYFDYGLRGRNDSGDVWIEAMLPRSWKSPLDRGGWGTSGPSSFFVAERKMLMLIPWQDFGPFTDTVWRVDLLYQNVRVALANAGVRVAAQNDSRPDQGEHAGGEVMDYAKLVCEYLKVGGVTAVKQEYSLLDCRKRRLERSLSKDSTVSW